MNPEIILIVFIILVGAVLIVVPYWSIFRKAGFDPATSLLMIVPIVNFVMLYYLAFTEWPSLKLQQKQAAVSEPSNLSKSR